MNRIMNVIFLSFLCFPFLGNAQSKETFLSGKINLDNQYEAIVVLPSEGMADGDQYSDTLDANGQFTLNFELAKPEFVTFTIIRKKRDRQMPINFPLYIKPGSKNSIALRYNDSTYLSIAGGNLSGGNKALVSYGNFHNLNLKELFFNPPNEENAKIWLANTFDTAHSYLDRFDVKTGTVKHYLEVWALNDYFDNLSTLESKFNRNGQDAAFSFTKEDLPVSPEKIYDYPEALYFTSTFRGLNTFLQVMDTASVSSLNQEKRLRTRFKTFNSLFTNQELKDIFNFGELSNYISHINLGPDADFQKEFKTFKEMTGQLSDTARKNYLIQRFSNLQYTSGGSEMPDIRLEDVNGNLVDLRSFEGEYVYIDLWASWCVPCIEEIPSLKKLQEDYKDKNITFLSISVDESEASWLKKVNELHLTGNQLHQGDSKFGTMMNVQGIPRFFLYDPSGKLMMYDAPRPSSTTIRNVFDAL